MSKNHNQTSVLPFDLAALQDDLVIIDVRKPLARAASGHSIPGSHWRHPFDAANWADEFLGAKVVLYCVHGHEVSQAVRGYLGGMGIDAVIIGGGFEAWKLAGLPVETLGDTDA